MHLLSSAYTFFLSLSSSSPKMIPTKATISVPSEDPKKKKEDEKPEEGSSVAATKKTKDEEKEGEDLVRIDARASGYQL